MRVVYRFDLHLEPRQSLTMSAGAEILKVERQTRFPQGLCLWALVDLENQPEEREILLVGTGHNEVPDGAKFISTYQEPDGFVWHFFDVTEAS